MLKTPCVTVRSETEWVDTLKGNWNVLAQVSARDILDKVYNTVIDVTAYKDYFGNGKTAYFIKSVLQKIGG